MYKILLLICLSGSFVSQNALADTVKIPAGQQGDKVWSGKTPARGLTKANVEAQFGAPNSKTGPNGTPPIYFWEYTDFTVYFEADRVIHSVIKHKPKV